MAAWGFKPVPWGPTTHHAVSARTHPLQGCPPCTSKQEGNQAGSLCFWTQSTSHAPVTLQRPLWTNRWRERVESLEGSDPAGWWRGGPHPARYTRPWTPCDSEQAGTHGSKTMSGESLKPPLRPDPGLEISPSPTQGRSREPSAAGPPSRPGEPRWGPAGTSASGRQLALSNPRSGLDSNSRS